MNTTKTFPAAIGAAVLLGSVIAAAPAQAGGTNFTGTTGTCSMGSIWKMKAKPQLGGIQMEFSVDTPRARQAWSVRVTDNGALVFSGNKVTNRISGSFSVNRTVADAAGTDRLVGRAKNAKTGEMCRGVLSFAPAGGGKG